MNTDRPIAKPAAEGSPAAASNHAAIDAASAPFPRIS